MADQRLDFSIPPPQENHPSKVGKQYKQPDAVLSGHSFTSSKDAKGAQEGPEAWDDPLYFSKFHRWIPKEGLYRGESARASAESKRKTEELARCGIDVHDFQVDADLERDKNHTGSELKTMAKKQKELAETYRSSVNARHEAVTIKRTL